MTRRELTSRRSHVTTTSAPAAPTVRDELVPTAVEVFAMLADVTRVRIIVLLGRGEQSVGVLSRQLCKAPAAVSQHLAKLRLARMVTARHDGTRVFYSLTDEHALELVTAALDQAEHAVDENPRHHGG